MDWRAMGLSFQLAAWTTTILFLVGLPLGYWLAMTRWRWKFLVEALAALPLVLPPTVLGFYILMSTGPESYVGRLIDRSIGTRLPFSFPGILLGSVLFNLPFAVRPFTAAFANLDRRLIEASWCLGLSRWQTFWQVSLPLSWPGILAGLVLTFSHSLGEFGVVLMVGGNIPGITRTLSLAIYDDVQSLNYSAAHRSSLILVCFALITVSFSHWLTRRESSR